MGNPANNLKTRIRGTLKAEGFPEGVVYQIDALSSVNGQPAKVVFSERYERQGPFRLSIPNRYDNISLVIYVDMTNDGPGSGDFRFEYEGNPIAVGETGEVTDLEFLIVHPDQEEIRSGALDGLEIKPSEKPEDKDPNAPKGEN